MNDLGCLLLIRLNDNQVKYLKFNVQFNKSITLFQQDCASHAQF